MHHLKIKSVLLFLFFSFQIFGQANASSSAPNIIPPSPTAYELGRYGQTDVGTFTGTPNISVPVYTYKTKNIAIPITLNYNSNGIQVDQMETNVGLGWNLNAGGIINRVVRGKADERRTNPVSEDMYCSDSFFTYIEKNQLNDTQPDMYSYNFQGQSGQFVFDNNDKAIMVNQNNLKIEKLGTNIRSGFKITIEDGVEYHFTDLERSTWENIEAPQTVITGWYLTKIVHPQGDVVNFTYRDSNYSFISNISESFGIEISRASCGRESAHPPQNYSINHLNIIGKTIESISSNESLIGSVLFQLTENPNIMGNFLVSGVTVFDTKQNTIEKADFNYLFTANKRIFLKECIFKDPSKKYSFEYEMPHDLVARLSDQRDLWGYYNGKPGTYPDPDIHKNLYPQTDRVRNALASRSTGDKRPYAEYARKGILKKIVYPTKGYNEFEYESNSVWGTVTSACETETQNSWFYNPDYNRKQKTEVHVFENKTDYQTEIQAKVFFNDYDLVEGEFPAGELAIMVTVENLTNSMVNPLKFYASEHNKPVNHIYKFLKDNTYRVSISFSPEPKTTGQVYFTYCKGGGVESKVNIPVAGLRIAKITSFDTAANTADVKHYYYGKKESPAVSTGTEGVQLNLLTFNEVHKWCSSKQGADYWNQIDRFSFMNINANSIYPLYRSMGNNSTTYENVTVSYGGANFENGGEEFVYYVAADIPPYLCLDSNLTSAPWTNLSWNNGLLHRKRTFNNRLIDLNIIENQYKLEDQYTRKVPGVATENRYEPLLSSNNPNYKNIEHLNISKYTTNSYWFYLQSESNTQYDTEGQNPVITVTKYKYNNPSHLKLSSQTVTNSLNEELETKYFYPQDLEMANEPFRNELIAKNMIGKVLDTQMLKKGAKLSEQKTIYDRSAATSNLLLPRFVSANKGSDPIDLISDKKVTYNQYDEKGNIVQYTLEGGNSVSIIWGYNKSQPIAKIENVAYAQLEALPDFGTGFTIATSLSTAQEIALRNNLPDAMVTTYTYTPLVGITSVTDPKGITSYYQYDTFGRLQYVKDHNSNVLQKYCYNYKGQLADCGKLNETNPALYKNSTQSKAFTRDNCTSGDTPPTILYIVAAGTHSSEISQADADAKAWSQINANGQAFANNDNNTRCTFWNTTQSRQFTRDNCAAGGIPQSTWYTVAAGIYPSTVSQAAADNEALKIVMANGQAFANSDNNVKCIFKSAAIAAQNFQKTDCTVGGAGSYVPYSLPYGAAQSEISQAHADGLAWTKFQDEGKSNANVQGDCTFRSIAITGSFQKSGCTGGAIGSYESYTLAEGAVILKTSQELANSEAAKILNTEGQTNANEKGQCVFYSVSASRVIRRTYCPRGQNGTTVTYRVPAGTYKSTISQAHANQQAEDEIDRQGQGYADREGECNEGAIEEK
ncbi:hypothetical protein Flavo103_44510 [Flavobacterium collinsii]|uniref:DUF5977 domain-containing protein n=1 Tax=Flavobacterium collinsii TaxID=1114861 RepID=UPI0022C3312D|nr:DUF5977 domain-containing protein [Flavobacterium collinsii]GIQ61316.1 hypothetical protein Flavo103_44510 [Flavobacterium collinsii]